MNGRRRRWLVPLMLVLTRCDGDNKSTGGVVPPDLRDVERAGEGLVSTTFGEYPTRRPDWLRAGQVLGILKTVWAKSKAQTPSLPAAQVQAVDRAIATLDTSV